LTQVRAVAHEIGKSINHYVVIVNKSTVPVGTGELVENIVMSYGVPQSLFDVVSNPEFLREGTALEDTRRPDRLIVGAERSEPAEIVKKVFADIPCPTLVTSRKSAELIKYASNSYLALKISFINAISRVCELSGARVTEVAHGVGMDARIGPQFLQAGLGWGGSCLPKDVQGLIQVAKNWGYDFELMKDVVEINQDQTTHFLKRLEHRLRGFKGKKIGILGLAFKPNTDDLRDAKSLIMIKELLAKGAEVRAYDPVAQKGVEKLFPAVKYPGDAYSVAKDADAVLLVTEWKELKELDLVKLASSMNQKILFDGRLAFKREAVEAAGLEYHVVGERSVAPMP
jgi:UDPglucose 6-dehydrogenase